MGVIAVADQQYAVTVVNRICLAHLEDVVGPFGLFGPTEAATDRPSRD